MRLFVDTSVWSLALRRDAPPDIPEVRRLHHGLVGGEVLFTTGLVLQELLQGFGGPRSRDAVVGRFSAPPFVVPERDDYVGAATLRNECRRQGLQVGTIDAILAGLCLKYGLTLLTTDDDFRRIARVRPLQVWGVPRPEPGYEG